MVSSNESSHKMKKDMRTKDVRKEDMATVIADKVFGSLFALLAIASVIDAFAIHRWYQLFTALMCAVISYMMFDDIKDKEGGEQ